MGVSLERVQFKFASIIGELCSEPLILSQFAVWLDLRLAEYKLRGSISLDCSGDVPPPCWLQGMEKAMAAKTGKAVLQHMPEDAHSARNVTHFKQTDKDVDRLSFMGSDVPNNSVSSYFVDRDNCEIIIEGERLCKSPEIYNASSQIFHNNSIARDHRKRSVTEAVPQSSNGNTAPTSPKGSRRVEPSLDVIIPSRTESLTNQSLMSIIGNTSSEAERTACETVVLDSVDSDDPHARELLGMGGNFTDIFPRNMGADVQIVDSPHFQPCKPNQSHMSGVREKRTPWSAEERKAIKLELLPIVQQTRKPPMKDDVQQLQLKVPLLQERHWCKIKHQAWSLYQQSNKKQEKVSRH